MMLRFQCFKKAVTVAAITHNILYRTKILKTCVFGTKIRAVESFLQHIPIVSILKIRAPILPWLNPGLVPNQSNYFDSTVVGHQLLAMNVALYHLTLRQCLQNSLMFERNLLILLSFYHYLTLKQKEEWVLEYLHANE